MFERVGTQGPVTTSSLSVYQSAASVLLESESSRVLYYVIKVQS